jgi:serine/threonine protein kinase
MLEEELHKLGITEKFKEIKFNVGPEFLPKQRVDGKILLRDGTERATLIYKELVNQGRYGLIQRCTRVVHGRNSELVVKRPRTPSPSLESEAFLQHICSQVLEKRGVYGAIPKVHDIFVFANEVRFSMDWIEGKSCMEFFNDICKRPEFEEVFNCCIRQICIILELLSRELHFNHRDLTPQNLWIRHNPGEYVLDGIRVGFQYQVVLLDFGFACLGNSVHLGDTIPAVDPCEKNGRDLYHLFSSLLTSSTIVLHLSEQLLTKLKGFMDPYEVKESYFTYLITSDNKFKADSLKPMAILHSL